MPRRIMPEVVILPGLDGSEGLRSMLGDRLRELGVRARTIGYPPHEPLNYDALEAFVRERLPASDPYVLIGESFSGPLAIRIAARPPASLSGLVLSTTFARRPIPGAGLLSAMIPLIPARPPMPLVAWWLLGPWSSPTLRASLRAALAEVDLAVLRVRAREALHTDVTPLLSSIRMPVLNLVAGEDRLLARSASDSMTQALPRCRAVTISGPHMLLQVATDACAHEIAAFARHLRLDGQRSPPTDTSAAG
jgi:pimeloyl-[acyl-carrier protein] methyl ester esterase